MEVISYNRSFMVRLTWMAEMRAAELDEYLQARIQLLKEDTDVQLRQLETLTPTINRARRTELLSRLSAVSEHKLPVVHLQITEPSDSICTSLLSLAEPQT